MGVEKEELDVWVGNIKIEKIVIDDIEKQYKLSNPTIYINILASLIGLT